MHGRDRELNWVQIRILNYLVEHADKYPAEFQQLRQRLIPEMQETVACTIFDLQNAGLVRVFDAPAHDGKLVEITAHGRAALFDSMTTSRSNCD